MISIVTTLYNYRMYITALIESVLKQTYNDWELIIVDDCSEDDPYSLIEEYEDDRINYIKLDTNQGYSYAKNTGIIAARGEEIVMIDADDMLTPTSLEVRHKALKNSDKLWCHGNVLDLSDGVISIKDIRRKVKLRESLGPRQYHVRLIHAQSVMVTKSFHRKVGLYDESLRCSSDTEMWDRALRLGVVPEYVDSVVSIYRRHGVKQMHNSLWKKKNLKLIIKQREEATERRVQEGVNSDNTRLLD